MLKAETFKEVQKTKDSQIHKDMLSFEKQVENHAKEMAKIRSELAAETKRREDLIDEHFKKIQNLNAQRESELDQERRERTQVEQDCQDKLIEMQTKLELSIKEREIELRKGLDERNQSNKSRYSEELLRAHDMLKERENDIDALERQHAQLADEKHQMTQILLKAEE